MSNFKIQALLRSGRHEEAERRLREICGRSDADAESLFLLGTLAGMRGDAERAESGFRKALALLPNFVQAQFNLAIALRDQGRLDEACAELEKVVARQTDHAEAWNTLGYLNVLLERHDEAERCFHAALAASPVFPDALTNLGNVLASRRCWEDAISHHRRALAIAPTHAGAAINLGNALVSLARIEEAIAAFRQAVSASPSNADAQVRLGTALNLSGERHAAEQAFRKALKLSPGHGEAQYFLATLGVGDRPHSAPSEYVSKLFDGYAETFDSELVDKLQYRTPEAIFSAVRAELADRRDLNVLDLGCGTGLCGMLFKALSHTLAGVDLSAKMVAKAQARAVYDELEIGELTDALRKREGILDVVLAADVFVYVGELNSVFQGAAKALRPTGIFAFSVEAANTEEGESYVLRGTGRYAHAHAYITQLAQCYGFVQVSMEELCVRLDYDQAIMGAIYVLRRTACALVINGNSKGAASKIETQYTDEATQVTVKKL